MARLAPFMAAVGRRYVYGTTQTTQPYDCLTKTGHRASVQPTKYRSSIRNLPYGLHQVRVQQLTIPATDGSRWLYMSAVTAPIERPHIAIVVTRPLPRRYATATSKSSTSCAPSVTHYPPERPEPCKWTGVIEVGSHSYMFRKGLRGELSSSYTTTAQAEVGPKRGGRIHMVL